MRHAAAEVDRWVLMEGRVPSAPRVPRTAVEEEVDDDRVGPRPFSIEKRRATRAHASVDVSLYSESQFFSGLSEDVSEGGLFVATYDIRPIGTEIELHFSLPTGHEISTRGVVRWLRNPGSDTSPGMGVQFAPLAPQDLAAIRAFVRHRPPLVWDDEPL
jgi:uncharacterized protein (TIGR02266 family)